ncbi:hypothetical protein CKY28_13295 [Sphingomonas lenta]|uniref:Uncharacterized protein n=2 Tax=Sphingomonas lenta TaxID=1141887 RepID=A0A2A2SCP4_9SPHN|nr:hypothetical protein CKY28_13295 [Sphingomonas lenta]
MLALAACAQQDAVADPERDQVVEAAAGPTAPSEAQRRIRELPRGQRDAVLLRAVTDGGAPCQGVIESERRPDVNGSPVFFARCSDGPLYGVAIDVDGMARVTRLDRGG